LRVRRYFCDRKNCSRKTFVEQVLGLSERHRRASIGLTGWLRSIAIELGGRPARGGVHNSVTAFMQGAGLGTARWLVSTDGIRTGTSIQLPCGRAPVRKSRSCPL
jgi:hypothetical protein